MLPLWPTQCCSIVWLRCRFFARSYNPQRVKMAHEPPSRRRRGYCSMIVGGPFSFFISSAQVYNLDIAPTSKV